MRIFSCKLSRDPNQNRSTLYFYDLNLKANYSLGNKTIFIFQDIWVAMFLIMAEGLASNGEMQLPPYGGTTSSRQSVLQQFIDFQQL